MKARALIVALIFAVTCQAQVKIKVLPATLTFLSGAAEGVMDGLQFHYDRANKFWNPDISWVNKYKNHDPAQGLTFKGRYMVFTTDGWHLMKFGRNLFGSGAVALHIALSAKERKRKWQWYAFDALTYWGINRAGFIASYSMF